MRPEQTSIGELAYRLWQSRGCPDGSAEQDWLDAEKQLAAHAETPGSLTPDVEPTPVKTANRPRVARAKVAQPKPSGNAAL